MTVRVKLDENLGRRTAQLFRSAGHDVSTIVDQRMAGASDDDVYSACCDEQRVIVTLDQDFANALRYDPQPTAGIAVLRVPALPSSTHLDNVAATLLAHLAVRTITGKLWVVTVGRVRQYEADQD